MVDGHSQSKRIRLNSTPRTQTCCTQTGLVIGETSNDLSFSYVSSDEDVPDQLAKIASTAMIALMNTFQVPAMYDGAQQFGYAHGGGFAYADMNFPESNYLKAFPEKEKAAPVAKVKVVVRKRPLDKREISKEDIIDIEQRSNSLTVHETKLKVDLTEYVEKHEFVFDAVLNKDVSNDQCETVEPVLLMDKPVVGRRTPCGLLPLMASQDILRLMHHTYRNQGFQLFVSFFEIYGGKLFDLLNDRREDGKQKVCIVGLQEYRVSDVETIKELIEKGSATRSTGTTGANKESSRSHAILQLAIKRRVDGNESKPPRPVGKLSFIDLASSERGADTTDNDKQTRIEGAEINKSLLALELLIMIRLTFLSEFWVKSLSKGAIPKKMHRWQHH
ncbi:hypothetical protein ACP4OV_013070 [Aristida adscensionis]